MSLLKKSRSKQPTSSRLVFGLLGLLVTAALVLTACGGGSETSASVNADGIAVSGGTPFVASTDTSPNNGLPVVNVIDLSDGSVVNFASAAPSPKTTVLWFWAPH